MIQWRNLNSDPDWHVNNLTLPAVTKTPGMPLLLQKAREKFPHVRLGYFNPPVASNQFSPRAKSNQRSKKSPQK
jgi:hypothetical protein